MFRSKSRSVAPRPQVQPRSLGSFGIAKDPRMAMTAMAGRRPQPFMMKKGGYVKAADGCAQRGKTKGRMV